MRSFSAHYVITNASAPLKRAIVNVEDDGRIMSVEDTGGNISEKRSVEFLDGIIIPAFVNCHCHLELSHMKGLIPEGTGLGGFILRIRSQRISSENEITAAAEKADRLMQSEGIVLCADICNTDITFALKKNSRVIYKNLLEVFGLDPQKADKRINEIKKVAEAADLLNLNSQVVPHSAYSLSLPLFRMVKELGKQNEITTIHFMETESEKELIEKQTGELLDSYVSSGIISSAPEFIGSIADIILNEVTSSGNLLLVHNTFADRETVKKINKRDSTYWCLCPSSNLYISGAVPPAPMLTEEGCRIVIGTDSLASNSGLSILNEIRILQEKFTSLTIEQLIRWATYNGAIALNSLDEYGSIEPGKRPGLLLLENMDISRMKILPGTRVRRII
jgi:cytosine/adenosine deaminase-related metal-dependent hydrolase